MAGRPETSLGILDTYALVSPPSGKNENSTAVQNGSILVTETKRLHPLGGLVASRPPVSFF